jgi:hypothetical protein
MSAFTDKVRENCLEEFKRFENGKGRETKDPFAGFVGEYWKTGLKINNIDGRTTFQDRNGQPFRPAWSAAFISFIMRKSGAGNAFFYSQAHIHYAVKAIRDAKVPDSKAKFLGRDPTTYAPKVGDLITAGRGATAGLTFSKVLQKYGAKDVPNGNFISTHSDIVVDVDHAKKRLTTIGGNVSVDTVGERILALKADGTLVKGPSFICVIECLL